MKTYIVTFQVAADNQFVDVTVQAETPWAAWTEAEKQVYGVVEAITEVR